MAEEWIEEFLYRGRPPSGPDSDAAPAFHVVIGQQDISPLDPNEKVRRTVGPLNVDQAKAAGWPLSKLLKGINEDALSRIAEQDAALAAKDSEIADLKSAISGLTPQ